MNKFCYVMTVITLMFCLGFSDNCEASFCDQETVVSFGNGMFNLQEEVEVSTKKLKRMLIEEGGLSEEGWVFEDSYNHHEGTAISLLEVYRQRVNDQTGSFWRWLGNVDVAPDWFQETAQSIATGYDLSEAIIDEDLQEHIQRYEALLLQGDRVLVVAHSQGNFYANSAYTNLAAKDLPMESFGIVSVATPASYVAGGGPYFTSANDVIIGGVRLLFPDTLDPNVANVPNLDDWSQHSFVTSYLNGSTSGPLIINSILSDASALAWPEPEIGKGLLSVTLTWGEQPDMDLHIFEPNWSHVFYADPVGLYGYLDRDDTNSYGPEHYYVDSCESLEPGTYKVAVNYYRGDGPEVAKVEVQAGDIIRNFSVPMAMAMGSYGNYRSWPVAHINVTEKPDGQYAFDVIGF